MQVNNTVVVARGNRPNVSQRVGLRTFFINDGAYVDPYEISSVKLFAQLTTLSPGNVLDSENLVSAVPLMAYQASGETLTDNANFEVTNYIPGVTASGIYRLGVGDYVVVLDQILALSGWDYTTSTQVAASSLSAVDKYVDMWAVKLNAGSKYQIITNDFNLYEDTFFAFTEPLLLTSRNKLMNKHIRFGETIDIKLGTEITIQNKDITQAVQNIFKDSAVTEATVTIKKVNQEPTFDGPFTVVDDATMQITKDNTLIYNWDTDATITGGASFGSITGTYSVQVKYTLLTETIISPLFYLTVS